MSDIKQDMHKMSNEELKENLIEMRKKQFNLRFQKANGALSDTHLFKQLRRNIARIKTMLNKKAGEKDDK